MKLVKISELSMFLAIILYNSDYLVSYRETTVLKETILSEEKINFNKEINYTSLQNKLFIS